MKANEQIKMLLSLISEGIYEKEQIVAMALLSAVAGESIFLLGPPGTAKSLVSRRLKLAFKDAESFEYLMSRFSTPDDIFGPVSISLLKNEDKYERVVDGYLPTATIVFLDEIWKAGPAIQNSLLTAINEKIFQNGNKTIQLPMKVLIAASNELPAEDEGLEALWDRFLIRMVSDNIKTESTFYKMIRQQRLPIIEMPKKFIITNKLYKEWQYKLMDVEIPDTICQIVTNIRKRLAEVSKQEDVTPMNYYVSDRRWKKCFHLMQASAFLNGRNSIDITDVVILFHCLWNKAELIPNIIDIVGSSITAPITNQLTTIEKSCENALNQKQNENKKEQDIDSRTTFATSGIFFYQIRNFPLGKCLFYKLDYAHVSDKHDTHAILYKDTEKKCWIINAIYTGAPFDYKNSNATEKQNIILKRINGGLIINGTPYGFVGEKFQSSDVNLFTAEVLPLTKEKNLLDSTLQPMFKVFNEMFSKTDNMFVSKRDLKVVHEYLKKCNDRMELVKVKLTNTRQLLAV